MSMLIRGTLSGFRGSARCFTTQAEQTNQASFAAASGQASGTNPKGIQTILSKSSEIRLLMGLAGATFAVIGALWKFSNSVAMKEETNQKIDKLSQETSQRFQETNQKLDSLKDILLADARHKQTISQQESISSRKRVHELEDQLQALQKESAATKANNTRTLSV